MKKFILLITIVLFSANAYCQDSGWAFGAYLTPSYSFRTLKSLNSTGNDTLKKLNSADQASGKFDFGLRLAVNISHHWRATIGVAYSTKGYITNMSADTTGPGQAKNTISIPQYNRYTFVEVPVYITYKMGDSSFNFGIVAGIANSFLMQYTQDVRIYDNQVTPFNPVSYSGSDLSANNYATYHISLLLGLEFGFKVSDNFNIFAQPNYRLSFTNFFPSPGLGDQLQGNLYNFGLSVGADYKF